MHDSESILLAKRILRHRLVDALASMDAKTRQRASNVACERVAQEQSFARARTIMLYLPLPGEADCTPLVERCLAAGCTVGVPVVDWTQREMAIAIVTSLDPSGIETDQHGVRVPRSAATLSIDAVDLVIVPGLAFDLECRRLGRGGGFYDRFLPRLPARTHTIGLAFDVQIVDQLPVAPHDAAVHAVATETRLISQHAAPSRRDPAIS
jgi:5-formyltetrahydrofolate cyclo-ligase